MFIFPQSLASNFKSIFSKVICIRKFEKVESANFSLQRVITWNVDIICSFIAEIICHCTQKMCCNSILLFIHFYSVCALRD